MYKIKIIPAISKNRLPLYREKIKIQKLIGSISNIHNGKYNLLKNTSHKILEIIEIDDETWALIDFFENSLGDSVKKRVEIIGCDKLTCSEFFFSKDNLGININI